MKVVHCDKVRSVHRFSATGRQSLAMGDFLRSEKNAKRAVFRRNAFEIIFFTKGTHIQLDFVYFFAKTPFGYGEFKGASPRKCNSLILPKMARFTHFTRFTRPACNVKHTYASTRVV